MGAGARWWWWLRRIWATFGVLVMAAMAWNVQAHGVPAGLQVSDDRVRVETRGPITAFVPIAAAPSVPFIAFLPGGLIQPTAYVPLVHGLAEAGIPAAIVEVPWRSAPTEGLRQLLWDRIDDARSRLAPDRPFILAGHSRGAALAARFAGTEPAGLDALVLIGTTHPRDQDLSSMPWPVLKIQGSNDCVAPPIRSRVNAHLLPPTTRWVDITGGNHQQFGFYGWQPNDCRAAISRADQHRQTIAAIVAFTRDVRRRGAAPVGPLTRP